MCWDFECPERGLNFELLGDLPGGPGCGRPMQMGMASRRGCNWGYLQHYDLLQVGALMVSAP